MSGPKVVRIVTREEAIATCERDLQRLDKALARWENQASRLAQLSDAERAAAHARRASLHALLEQERWLDVQLQVKIESEFLKRDLAEREERAIRQAAETRQQHRRLQENASALLQALDARPDAASAALRQTLQALADGALRDDAEALLAQGFAALASAPVEERLSAAQHELAQRLKTDEAPITLEQWRARQQQDAPREQRLARIDRHIAELQLLQGEASAQAFLERLARAEAEQRPERRNLLLDSLVLDLAQAAREHQQQRQRLEHLQDLASEVAALGAAEYAELLQRAAACQPDSDPQQLAELTERCNAILTPTSSNRPPSPAARPCSRASPASATKSAKAWPPPGRRPAGSSCANPPPPATAWKSAARPTTAACNCAPSPSTPTATASATATSKPSGAANSNASRPCSPPRAANSAWNARWEWEKWR